MVSFPVLLAISGWHFGYISFELFKDESPVMAENISALEKSGDDNFILKHTGPSTSPMTHAGMGKNGFLGI
ncbi:hypothetical protein A6R68_23963, partial [Neotoma lepida]